MDIIKEISDCIVNMDEDEINLKIDEALALGKSFDDIYHHGLNNGMLRVTKLFDEKKYFISEVIVCADTINKGIQYLKKQGQALNTKGPKVVIAVVFGDLHEIGKNILKILFEAADFDVVDLGLNVSSQEIVKKAILEKADVIGLSTMMTTTRGSMKEVIDILNAKELTHKPKVVIGGGCINAAYAKSIGADGYSSNAIDAVKMVKNLLGGEQRGEHDGMA